MNSLILFQLLSILILPVNGGSVTVNQVNSIEFQRMIRENNGTLLDVRTSPEFSNGHIKDAGQLNYYAFDFKKRLLLLSKNEPVYLYCNTGYRSHRAAEILAINGYKHIYNLQEGIMEWNLQDMPIIIEPDAQPDTENKMEPDEYTMFIQSHPLVFIDFYAPWCAPCRKMIPMIDSLQKKNIGKINIIKVNVDASKKLIKELQIGGVPYLVLYKNGEIVYSHSGLLNKEKLVEIFESIN